MSSLSARSARAARAAVDAAIRNDYDRKRFVIEKFGLHRDGYLHARIVVDGTQAVYLHRRYGSWLVPGTIGGRAVQKEPEGALGSVLGTAVKYALSDASKPYDDAWRRERAQQREAERLRRMKEEGKDASKSRTSKQPDNGRVDDEAEPAAGLPEGGGSDDAGGAVREDDG